MAFDIQSLYGVRTTCQNISIYNVLKYPQPSKERNICKHKKGAYNKFCIVKTTPNTIVLKIHLC